MRSKLLQSGFEDGSMVQRLAARVHLGRNDIFNGFENSRAAAGAPLLQRLFLLPVTC
jgi:hypothetical protein